MPKVFLTNQSYANGALAVFNLKAQLKINSWVVKRSSDGTTFNASGDQITTGASGANGMANDNAWFVIEQPVAVAGVKRQWMFMRGSSGNEFWTIRYSQSAGFTGGSATVPATAADHQFMYGTEVVSGSPLFSTGNRRVSMMNDSTTPYGWIMWWHNQATTVFDGFICCDPLVAGSYNALDTDPYVLLTSAQGAAGLYNSVTGSGGAAISQAGTAGGQGVWAWYKRGLTGAAFVNCAVGILYFGTYIVYQQQGQNGYATKDDLFPYMYGRGGANGAQTQPFIKGTGTILLHTSTNRASQDTLTVSTTRDYVILGGGTAVSWDGSVVTL